MLRQEITSLVHEMKKRDPNAQAWEEMAEMLKVLRSLEEVV